MTIIIFVILIYRQYASCIFIFLMFRDEETLKVWRYKAKQLQYHDNLHKLNSCKNLIKNIYLYAYHMPIIKNYILLLVLNSQL